MYILNESKRDNFLIPYIEMFKSKGQDVTLGQLKTALLKKFTEEGGLRNLSLGSNFYLAGAARYYFNGDLTLNKDLGIFTGQPDNFRQDICQRLNALILILRNGVVDSLGQKFEQPEDFGTLSIDKLLRKYNKKIDAELGIKVPKKNDKLASLPTNGGTVGNGYTFDILYSYNDATKYNQATSPGAWCITYGQQHFKYYTNHYMGHFVVFRKNGWENIPRKKGQGWTPLKPQDEYGCSLIAYLQSNDSPDAKLITSRWNHGYGYDSCEADHAFSQQEFMAKTGVTEAELKNIFELWKETRRKRTGNEVRNAEKKEAMEVLRDLKYRQMRINGGESMESALGIKGNGPKAEELSKYGITAYATNIRGKKYYVLAWKRNIIFESLIDVNNPYSKYYFCYGKRPDYTDFNIIDNGIIFVHEDNSYHIWDIRRHDFVRVEETIRFKEFNKFYQQSVYDSKPDVPYFYIIKMGPSQYALIDGETNKALVLPNGRSWIEAISYGNLGHVYKGYKYPPATLMKKGIFAITYDSPRAEYYWYNAENGRFFNMPNFITDEDAEMTLFTKEIYCQGLVAYKIIGRTHLNSKCRLLTYDSKTISFGHRTDFFDVAVSKLGFVMTVNYEGNKVLFSPAQESYLYLDGKILYFGYEYTYPDLGITVLSNGNGDMFILLHQNDDSNHRSARFLLNPKTGDERFKLKTGLYNIVTHNYKDDKTYINVDENTSYSLDELQISNKPAFIPHSSPMVYDDGKSQSQAQNPATVGMVNEDIIRNMVRRILKESLDKNVMRRLTR